MKTNHLVGIILFTVATSISVAYTASSISVIPSTSPTTPSSTTVTPSTSTTQVLPILTTSTPSPSTSTATPSSTTVTSYDTAKPSSLSIVLTPSTSTATSTGTSLVTTPTPVVTSLSLTPSTSIATSTGTSLVTTPTPVVTSLSLTPSTSTATSTGKSFQAGSQIISDSHTSYTFDPSIGTNQIIIPDTNAMLSSVTIPATVLNPTINYQNIMTSIVGGQQVILSNPLSISSSTNQVNMNVAIPAGIQITGPSSWDGTLNLPTPSTTSVNVGQSNQVISNIEIGFGTQKLSLDKAVRLEFAGQAGDKIGYSYGGPMTEITTICTDDTQTTNNGLPNGGDCKINVGSDLIVWTKHFSSFVTFGPATGSKGDSTPGFAPSFTTGFLPNQFPLTINGVGIKFNNYQSSPTMTQIIQVGNPVSISLLLYGDNGPSSVQHVTLFTNLHNTNREVQDSDTALVWDRSSGLSIIDPHHFFGNVEANPTDTSDGKFKLDLIITFANPMPTSDIILRTWGSDLYSTDVDVPKAWESIAPMTNLPTTSLPTTNGIQTVNESSLINNIKEWGSNSQSSISNSELLKSMGISGQHIPLWVQNTARWVIEGQVSQQDFIKSINYLYTERIIK